MPYNLMLLPLLGGYFFLTQFKYYRFKYSKLSYEKLLFASVFTGTLLIFILYAIRLVVDTINPHIIKDIYVWLYKMFPINKVDYLWTSVISFWFAILGTILLNQILMWRNYFGNKLPFRWWVDKYGNELEELFMNSVIEGKAIQVTLKSRKTYIGFITETPGPGETNYVKLTPLISGYRKEESLELVIVTNYFAALKKLENENYGPPLFDYDITIKQDEIMTATFFHIQLQNSLEEISRNNKKNKKK